MHSSIFGGEGDPLQAMEFPLCSSVSKTPFCEPEKLCCPGLSGPYTQGVHQSLPGFLLLPLSLETLPKQDAGKCRAHLFVFSLLGITEFPDIHSVSLLVFDCFRQPTSIGQIYFRNSLLTRWKIPIKILYKQCYNPDTLVKLINVNWLNLHNKLKDYWDELRKQNPSPRSF